MAELENRLFELLDEELNYPGTSPEIARRAKQLEQQMAHDAEDHGEERTKAIAEAKGQYAPDPEEAPKRRRPRIPMESYRYESRSTYNGHDYVEEHREKVTDADGVVHTTLRRRLGDRWYEQESHTDKEGKVTSKETWHNVPEDHTEAFKKEWEEKHGQKTAALQAPEAPAVEDKTAEEKPKDQ